jgi:hypothetical protein
MSPAEAGYNAIKQMLYYMPLRGRFYRNERPGLPSGFTMFILSVIPWESTVRKCSGRRIFPGREAEFADEIKKISVIKWYELGKISSGIESKKSPCWFHQNQYFYRLLKR